MTQTELNQIMSMARNLKVDVIRINDFGRRGVLIGNNVKIRDYKIAARLITDLAKGGSHVTDTQSN